MTLKLINGVYNTQGNTLEPISITITEGVITGINDTQRTDRVIDLKGQFVMPGLVDIHTHLREPGFLDKETIKTGTQAAARGGVTTICAMPNTNPVPDTKEKFETIKTQIKKDACVHTFQYAPITHELRSDHLVDMAAIDAFAYTNDGVGVQSAGVMYEAMKLAQSLNKPIVAHTEDDSLLFGGVMHEGIRNKQLNIPGIMGIVESSQIVRDILIALETGVHYHICHVSSKESVAAIRWGKSLGVNVTGEVSPHHLILNEMDIVTDDAVYKMNPPLRSKEDQQALIEGVLDGTLQVIATDHAPHTTAEKKGGFEGTPFGIVGIETSFALIYTHFIKKGIFSFESVASLMSETPATLFKLPHGTIKVGGRADLAVFDLEKEYVINPQDYQSKSSVSPFNGTKVFGMCTLTLVNGVVVWNELEGGR